MSIVFWRVFIVLMIILFFIVELGKKLSKKKLTGVEREVTVIELLESICSPPNFVEYEYSPPKTVAACKFLLGKYVCGKICIGFQDTQATRSNEILHNKS